MKVLIIDDDPLHLSSLETSLRVRDYECMPFLSPVAALEAYQTEPVDVVITAVKMLEITGEEVLNKVRTINPKAKVIFITGFDDVKINVDEKSGIHAFFRKPIVINDLIDNLENIKCQTPTHKSKIKRQVRTKTQTT